jgi:hypothetical protein
MHQVTPHDESCITVRHFGMWKALHMHESPTPSASRAQTR